MRKILFIVFVLLFSILVYLAFRFHAARKSRYELSRTLASTSYQDRLSSFNDNEIDSNSIVFLGNSLTELFDLSQFNNPHTVNRGICGDFTEGVIARMDGIIKKHPKKIFIEIGINDLVEKIPQEAMYKNYDSILGKIIYISPHSLIYVHSLLPTRLNGSIITSAGNVNKRVMEFNALLVKLSEKRHCIFIDIWSKFAMKDNSMNPALTTDGIHLTPEGYKIWESVIENSVNH